MTNAHNITNSKVLIHVHIRVPHINMNSKVSSLLDKLHANMYNGEHVCVHVCTVHVHALL